MSRFVQRGGLHGKYEVLSDPRQGCGSKLDVFRIRDCGVEVFPKLLENRQDQLQTLSKTADPLSFQDGFSQPRRQPQVLCFFCQRVRSQFRDQFVIGRLSFVFSHAFRDAVVFAPGFFDLVEDRFVSEIDSARVVSGDGVQQIVT